MKKLLEKADLVIKEQLDLIKIEVDKREEIYRDRSEKWQDSQKWEDYQENTEELDMAYDELDWALDTIRNLL